MSVYPSGKVIATLGVPLSNLSSSSENVGAPLSKKSILKMKYYTLYLTTWLLFIDLLVNVADEAKATR